MEQRVDLEKVRPIVFEHDKEQRVITELLLVARHHKLPKEITKMIFSRLEDDAVFFHIRKIDTLLKRIKIQIAYSIGSSDGVVPVIGKTICLGLIREWIDGRWDHYHDPASPEDVYFVNWLVETANKHPFFKKLDFSVTFEERKHMTSPKLLLMWEHTPRKDTWDFVKEAKRFKYY